MTSDRQTGTNNKATTATCTFPRCVNNIAGDRSGELFCVTHSTLEYKETFDELDRGRRAVKELEELKREQSAAEPKAGRKARLHIYFSSSELRPPYELTRYGNQGYIVETAKDLTVKRVDLPPDLFIRFADLPDEESAYLEFAKSYGLLDIRKLYPRHFLTTGKGNEESIELVRQFQQELKHFFGISRRLIAGNGNNLSEPRTRLYQWLTHVLRETGIGLVQISGDSIPIYAKTLAGTLALQLYQFTILGKAPKECALPGCLNLTTRDKYCSEGHKNLFNAWKRRGKITLKNGVWEKLPSKRKESK